MYFMLTGKKILAVVMALLLIFCSCAGAETAVRVEDNLNDTDMIVVSEAIDAPVEEIESTDLFILGEMAEIFEPEADLDIDINDGCDVHVFDFSGVCISCGKACTHPEEECEDLNIPVAYAQMNAEQHSVTYEIISKCWACGMTFEDAGNTFTAAEDHFDYVRECDCGYINPDFEEDDETDDAGNTCKHPNISETVYLEFGDIISSTDEEHEILWIQMRDYSCPDCDYESTRPTGKTVVRIDEHKWDPEGTGYCEDCFEACRHPKTMQQNYWEEKCESADENTHSVVQTLYARVCCTECLKTYSVKTDDTLEYTEAHRFDANGECDKCGFEDPEGEGDTVPGCTHAAAEPGYVYETAGIKEGDKNGHIIAYEAYISDICAECGEEISRENRVRDESKDYTEIKAHEWADGSDVFPFGSCLVCGGKNACKHAKATVSEVNVGLNYTDITETTHDSVGIVVEVFECPDCTWTYANANGKTVYETDEPHKFVNGICVCGYNCVHSHETETLVDISYNVSAHTTVTTTIERCTKCDVVFSVVPVTVTDAHEFVDDVCTYCKFDGIRTITLPEKLELGLKESRVIPMSYLPDKAENNISYSSSKSSVVRVDAKTGKMTAKKTGTAVITASTEEGAVAICTVTVRKAPTSVKASVSRKTLGVGETFTITGKISSSSASAFTFSSSKKSVAKVDKDGVITAVAPGTAKIYVKTFNGKKAYCTVTVKPAPEVVEVTPSASVVSVGQTAKLTTGLTTVSGKTAAGAYTYSIACDPADCATIENGVVTAHKEGKVTVTATTYLPEVKGTAGITILPAPDKAKIDNIKETAITLGVNEKFTLKVSAENGSPADFTFSSDRKSVATVSSSGKITAKKKGTAVITATPHLGEPVSVTVTVVSAPKSVKLSAKKLTLGVGEDVSLKATLSSGSASALKWKSSKSSVVSVDANGNLTPKSSGTATITVSTFNGKKASCSVTVRSAPEVVKVSSSKDIMSVGQTAKLTTKLTTLAGKTAAGAYAYTAEPADCVTIEKGVVTPVKAGTVTITATTYKNLACGSVTIEIKEAPDAIVIGKELTLGVGEKFTLKPGIANGSPADFEYKSTAKSVASVSASGKITANKRGSATITVTANNMVSETVSVTVKAAPKGVRLSAKTLKLTVGDIETLTAEVTSGASNKMTWKSSKTSVVRVENGVLTAVGKGTATITVSTFNGKKATCRVTVSDPVVP